jgi:hypothetical protein
VKNFLGQYESVQDDNSKIELIFDDERMCYMVLWVGWHKYKRIHQCAVHIDLVGDRILIQHDPEDAIAEKLVEMGISPENILMIFIHPQHQNYEEKEVGAFAALRLISRNIASALVARYCSATLTRSHESRIKNRVLIHL